MLARSTRNLQRKNFAFLAKYFSNAQRLACSDPEVTVKSLPRPVEKQRYSVLVLLRYLLGHDSMFMEKTRSRLGVRTLAISSFKHI